MLDAVQDALARAGIEDELVAAGLFFPRGHSGGAFVGGLIGGGSATRWAQVIDALRS